MPFRFYIITMFLFLCFSSAPHLSLNYPPFLSRLSPITPLLFLCDIILA